MSSSFSPDFARIIFKFEDLVFSFPTLSSQPDLKNQVHFQKELIICYFFFIISAPHTLSFYSPSKLLELILFCSQKCVKHWSSERIFFCIDYN